MLRSTPPLFLILGPILSFVHAFLFLLSQSTSSQGPPDLGRMPLVVFLLAGKWCREKGRFSPFAQRVRNFLELNCPFLKVAVLTLGSQYPWRASLVVRSKWSVNTPGSSSFLCSDQYSELERGDVTWSLLLPSLWSPPFSLTAHFDPSDDSCWFWGVQQQQKVPPGDTALASAIWQWSCLASQHTFAAKTISWYEGKLSPTVMLPWMSRNSFLLSSFFSSLFTAGQ